MINKISELLNSFWTPTVRATKYRYVVVTTDEFGERNPLYAGKNRLTDYALPQRDGRVDIGASGPALYLLLERIAIGATVAEEDVAGANLSKRQHLRRFVGRRNQLQPFLTRRGLHLHPFLSQLLDLILLQ